MDNTRLLHTMMRAESSGELDGLEIEHYVSGGLPPPYYRAEQFRLFVDHGRATLAFVVPNFTANVSHGDQYPRDVYKLPASSNDVRAIMRVVRESGAFVEAARHESELPRDGIKTELVVIVGDLENKRVYAGDEPPDLAKLHEVINPLIFRLKTRGEHQLVP